MTVTIPNSEVNTDYNISELTSGELGGNGTFDIIMGAVNAHIENQFKIRYGGRFVEQTEEEKIGEIPPMPKLTIDKSVASVMSNPNSRTRKATSSSYSLKRKF